jgi:hypothetical protein
MATRFIKYEKALLKIANTSIFAESATLSFSASLEPVTDVTGSIIRYAPQGPTKGTLSFSHYCTGDFHDFLNPLTAIEHTGEAFNGSFAGLSFESGFVRSLSFSVAPFQPILFQSEIDLYGSLGSLSNNGMSDSDFESYNSIQEEVPIAHGLRSFLAGDGIGVNKQISFDYSVKADRNPVVTIGNEVPYRVTKENVIIDMSVKGEDFGNAISFTGTNAGVVIKIYDVYGESPLTEFGCTGQIYQNDLSVAANGFLQGGLSLSQEYLTGKASV